jgi:RNA polymerase sigma-70 factor (ECF subfamily)
MNHSGGHVVEQSDGTLLRRFRSGEGDAATALYVRYASRLQALARMQTAPNLSARFDPEDVVQSVFRTFFRRAAEGLYDVPPGAQLWQLLLVLALNKVRSLASFHRAQRRDVRRTAGDPSLEIHRGADDQTPAQILNFVVQDVLGQLPVVQQQIVELRIDGHEVGQIADITGRSKRTVERVLQKFRLRLAELIDDADSTRTANN